LRYVFFDEMKLYCEKDEIEEPSFFILKIIISQIIEEIKI